jgi:hypothetical protein
MPVETAIEQTEVPSININERSLALEGGQVERKAFDVGDLEAKMLRCSVSTQLDWPRSVRVSGIVGTVYHHQPVTVAVVIIHGVSGTRQCRSHGGASLGR